MTDQRTFASTCVGNLHSWLFDWGSGTVGRALNAFDTTINIRTDKDELLVITLGKLRSPVNLNVTPGIPNMGFRQVVEKDAKATIQIGEQPGAALLVGGAVIMLGEHDIFRNHFSSLDPLAIQMFENNSHRIFSALESEAKANRLGCLLNPDPTTRGLFVGFVDELISYNATFDRNEFNDRISAGLQQLCGKGPGFTPAGDDFIAGYLAMSNWLRKEMKTGDAVIPGKDFSALTTWTSFKLIEYSARNLLDEQMQHMINCVAHNDIDSYIQTVELVSKRGHTSGLDFATGMTIALFAAADRACKTSVLENMMKVLDA